MRFAVEYAEADDLLEEMIACTFSTTEFDGGVV